MTKNKFYLTCLVIIAMTAGFLFMLFLGIRQHQISAQSNQFVIPGLNWIQFNTVATPANPASGLSLLYVNSPTGLLTCLNSSGGNCGTGVLSGTTEIVTGTLLAVGACNTGTATVAGATTSMAAIAQPTDGTDFADSGFTIQATVISANTVKVNLCAAILGTPASKAFNVRVIP